MVGKNPLTYDVGGALIRPKDRVIVTLNQRAIPAVVLRTNIRERRVSVYFHDPLWPGRFKRGVRNVARRCVHPKGNGFPRAATYLPVTT
jgi:hypothetical protein